MGPAAGSSGWWPPDSISDPEITRYRPKILVNEDSQPHRRRSQCTWGMAQGSALGEANTSEITLAGWRENNDSGPLWQTNKLVQVEGAILSN